MFCPNCGKANSVDQKFCRSCGFNLEETARSIVQQLPAGHVEHSLAERRELVEKMLFGLGGVGLTGFVAFLIWRIVVDIIVGMGQVLGGVLLALVVLILAFLVVLAAYRQDLIDKAAKRPLSSPETPLPEPTTRQLGEPTFEPIPSVTEPTTDLLVKENTNLRTDK